MRSKRYNEAVKNIESREYQIEEAVEIVKEAATVKFDESMDIVIVLGVDPKKSDQMVRGNVVLPNGTGKEIRVAVAVEDSDIDTAKEAGADLVGKEDVIKAIESGNLDFDVLISSPACMKDLGKYGKVLGPRGLMPSPKSGTVVQNVEEAIKKVKKGQIEFKMDKFGVIHGIFGKASFTAEQLTENFNAYIEKVKKSRPASAKGKFIKKVCIASTMGPSFNIST